MHSKWFRALVHTAGFALVAAVFSSRASAAVVGTLNIANSSGQGLTLSSTAIDFLPASGGAGTIDTGIGTNISYAGGGPMAPGNSGQVKDISFSPVLDFMTFAVHPLLHFDLTSIGPGVTNTTAVNSFDPNSAPSSPSVGSPYILQATSSGTTLTFTVAGIARDSSTPDSLWSGLFTTQLAGVTPFQVQQALLASGTVSSTYSASISTVGLVPEPASLGMLLFGLLPLARRQRSRI